MGPMHEVRVNRSKAIDATNKPMLKLPNSSLLSLANISICVLDVF
jgi:hypothetical protein